MKQLSLWYQKPPWMSSALSERSASASADTIPSCWLAYPRHGSGSNTTNRAARSPAARYYRYPAPAVHFCTWSRRVPQNPPPPNQPAFAHLRESRRECGSSRPSPLHIARPRPDGRDPRLRSCNTPAALGSSAARLRWIFIQVKVRGQGALTSNKRRRIGGETSARVSGAFGPQRAVTDRMIQDSKTGQILLDLRTRPCSQTGS